MARSPVNYGIVAMRQEEQISDMYEQIYELKEQVQYIIESYQATFRDLAQDNLLKARELLEKDPVAADLCGEILSELEER